MSKILVVDDDRSLLNVLGFALDLKGFEVVKVSEGRQALSTWRMEDPDLVVLDANLPDSDGFEICRVARHEEHLVTPVIMLTARTRDEDVAQGFAVGADDYVTKPFSPELLLARMTAVLRRSGGQPADGAPLEQLVVGSMRLDPDRQEFVRKGKQVRLTPIEFRLMHNFLKNANTVLRADRIVERVWGRDAQPEGGSLKAHIRHLREKVEANPSRPELIVTVPGVGYMCRVST